MSLTLPLKHGSAIKLLQSSTETHNFWLYLQDILDVTNAIRIVLTFAYDKSIEGYFALLGHSQMLETQLDGKCVLEEASPRLAKQRTYRLSLRYVVRNEYYVDDAM